LLIRACATNSWRADFSESLQDWLRVLQQESRGKYELEYRCWKRIIYSTLPQLDILFSEQDEAVLALQLAFRQKRREEAEAREREEAEAREREEAVAREREGAQAAGCTLYVCAIDTRASNPSAFFSIYAFIILTTSANSADAESKEKAAVSHQLTFTGDAAGKRLKVRHDSGDAGAGLSLSF
jgi:hypothetical protein